MKFKILLAIVTVVILTTSCRNNSTDKSSSTDTVVSTTKTNTTVPEAMPATHNFPVPDKIKTSFEAKYPAVAAVNWSRYEPMTAFDWDWSGWPKMDSSDYMVKFSMDSIDYWEWYDNDYNWVGTVSAVPDVNGLPPAVSNTVNSEFPGYTIISVNKENDKNRTAYEIQLTKGDDKMKALISESGALMKKKGVVAGDKMKEKNM
ncbi:MAG: PepSY-like domain-containing protein [Bacteroidota bacterium]